MHHAFLIESDMATENQTGLKNILAAGKNIFEVIRDC